LTTREVAAQERDMMTIAAAGRESLKNWTAAACGTSFRKRWRRIEAERRLTAPPNWWSCFALYLNRLRGRGLHFWSTIYLQSTNGKLSCWPLVRTDAADMLKRRLKQAGLPAHYSPHSFRATGITNFLENDGTLEAAQRIAGHADSRTTKLYDRRGQKVLLEDMERIRY